MIISIDRTSRNSHPFVEVSLPKPPALFRETFMEIAYLHLVTNHIPIIGVPFALAVLIIGIWRKSDDLKAVAFLIFAFLGAATLAVYFLGQGGEDFIEELPGVSHDAIEDHEEFAIYPLISVLIAAVVSLFALIRYGGFSRLLRRTANTDVSRSFPGWLPMAVLAIGLISAALLGYVGRLGGVIRHPEFHGGVAASAEKQEEAEKPEDENGGRGRGRNRGER